MRSNLLPPREWSFQLGIGSGQFYFLKKTTKSNLLLNRGIEGNSQYFFFFISYTGFSHCLAILKNYSPFIVIFFKYKLILISFVNNLYEYQISIRLNLAYKSLNKITLFKFKKIYFLSIQISR